MLRRNVPQSAQQEVFVRQSVTKPEQKSLQAADSRCAVANICGFENKNDCRKQESAVYGLPASLAIVTD